MNSPDHVYYNIRIQNGNPDTAIPAVYSENRVVPIINNPCEYYMSCIRFSVPTSLIPILVVPVQPNQSDPTLTIYSVSLSYKTFTAQQYVKWTPKERNSLSSAPIEPRISLSLTKISNPDDSYYYCRSYVHLMDLVNDAFALAFADLTAQVIAASQTMPSSAIAPYFTFDPSSKLFSLNADASYDVDANANPIKCFFNNDLYTLFGAFDSFLSYNAGEQDRQILIRDLSNNTTDGIINFSQEFPTLVCWSSFKSIIITTGTLPIYSEGIPNSNRFLSNTSSSGQASSLNIISDFDCFLNVGSEEFVSLFQYNPAGNYRLIDMHGTNPVSNVDLSVFWQDTYGGLHPIFIPPNQSATFKMLFRKKALGVS